MNILVSKQENHVNYCKDITKTVGFGSYQKPHFMWDDCQFTRRDTLTQKLNQQINTDKTEVWLKRTFCEGMYVPMKVAITLQVINQEETNAKIMRPVTSLSKLVIVQRNLSMCGLLQMTEGDGLGVYVEQYTIMRNWHLMSSCNL